VITFRSLALAGLAALALGACGSSAPAARREAFAPAGAAQAPSAHSASGAVPEADWPQFGYSGQRSGSGPASTGIDAGDLRRLRRLTVPIPGTADSSAIYLHDVLVRGRRRDAIFLTTSYGRTLALDASSGRILWQFRPKDIGAYQASYRFTTATPTADPDRRYIYATSPDGYVHKLSVADGRQVWSTQVTYYPQREKLASPPSLLGRSLIVVSGGYFGDAPSYQGHVVRINRATGRITAVFNTLCSDRRRLLDPPSCPASDSAIWGRAGAVITPGGRILIATGNGPFNGSSDWGDSVLELSGGLRLLHNWTPRDQAVLDARDEDLGSTSPALLPDPGGPPLVLQGGKSGRLSLLDLSRLNGTGGPAGPRTGGQLQTISAPGGSEVFAQPAVWRHGGRSYVFVADGAGSACYQLLASRLHLLWSDRTPGTSPVIAGGLLYVYDQIAGRLVIRRPLQSAPIDVLAAAPGHWNSPIVAGGRIILPVGGGATRQPLSGTLYLWQLAGR
jgi:outer membrane protein assembly factor BamB